MTQIKIFENAWNDLPWEASYVNVEPVGFAQIYYQIACCSYSLTLFSPATATSKSDIYIQHNTAQFIIGRMWSHKTFLISDTTNKRNGHEQL